MKFVLTVLIFTSLMGCSSVDLVGEYRGTGEPVVSHVSFIQSLSNEATSRETYENGPEWLYTLSIGTSKSGKQRLYFETMNLNSDHGFCSVEHEYVSDLEEITEDQFWVIGEKTVRMGVYCKRFADEPSAFYQVAYPASSEGLGYLIDLFTQRDKEYNVALFKAKYTPFSELASKEHYSAIYYKIREDASNSHLTDRQVGEKARRKWADDLASVRHFVTIKERSSKHTKSYQMNPSGFGVAWEMAGGDAL